MTIQQSLRTSIHTMKADLLTPVTIFKRLQGRHKFLLESSAKYEEAGRYSFIGVNPRKTYYGNEQTLFDVLHEPTQQYSYDGDLLQTLKQVMPRVSSVTDFPFIGGAVGYIRYGAGTDLLEHEAMPEVQFHVYDTLVIFDHIKDELTIVHTNIDIEHQQTDMESIIAQLQNNETLPTANFTMQQLQYELATAEIQQTATATFNGDAFELYRKLRIQLPGAYLYYLQFDDHTIIGSSKDSFISVTEGRVQAQISNPTDPFEVEALQKVTTDLTVNDAIQATLQPGLHSLDALATLLPPQTVVATQSKHRKKAYGSVIGYIGFNGQIDFTLANQVIVIENNTLTATAAGSTFTHFINTLLTLSGGTK